MDKVWSEEYIKKVERDNNIDWLISGGVAFGFVLLGGMLVFKVVSDGGISYWEIFLYTMIAIMIVIILDGLHRIMG